MIPVELAVEDELSEAVLRRLLAVANRRYAVGVTYGRRGNGYLKKTVRGWNRAAQGKPFVLLTDLDEFPCPAALIGDWLHDPQHHNLLFRVAVREVESWLLADSLNLAAYLSVGRSLLPNNPDGLADPKATLIQLASRSRNTAIRTGIVPKTGSTAKQGPDYNACLSSFVRQGWHVPTARRASPSLDRTFMRLSHFSPVWPGG